MLAVALARFGRRAIAPLAAVLLVGLLAAALLASQVDAFASALDFTGGTNFVRLRLWESSISMLRDKPLTGLGLDQFLYFFGGEYVKPDAIWDADLSHPHNFILDFWTRLSLGGLALFAVIQVVFWRCAFVVRPIFRERSPLLFAMTIGLCGSMAALLAHGMVDNSVFVIDLAFLFMFIIAVMTRLGQLAEMPAT